MRDSTIIQQLERSLIVLQLPVAWRQRALQELSDHRDDLIGAALDEGLSETEAAARADQSLGDPTELADQIVLAARRSSWWGRHPFVAFGVFPFFGMILAVWLTSALALGAFYISLPAKQWDALDGSAALTWMTRSLQFVHVLVVTLAAWAFCRLVFRSVTQRKWLWIATVICSLCAYFLYCAIHPHNLVFGLQAQWPPNYFHMACALIPLAIAFLISRRQCSQLLNRLSPIAAAAILLPLLGSGCATHKHQPSEPTTHTRAWLGGEYRIAKNDHNNPLQSPRIAYTTNYPTCLPSSKAIKVTHIATNSPAYLAGLRSGDYLTEVANKKVETLHQLRRVFNSLPAASIVQLKVVRDNKLLDLTVQSGTEKYHDGGDLVVAFPSIVEGWDLWPNPGFSLVFLGYQTSDKLRHDLNGAKELSTGNWHTWCAIFQISTTDQILSQISSGR